MAGENQPTAGDQLSDKILKAVMGIVVLKVTTMVGTPKPPVTGADGATTIELDGAPQKVGSTVINTVLGDSTTIYSPDFAADATLMAAHKDAVEAAHKVRSDTIDILKTILKDFEDILKKPAA
jgi:hypothetical protein